MEIKYDNHRDNWVKCTEDIERIKIANTWMNSDSLGHWRMKRMLGILNPFIKKNTKWLTIGDGRFGTDANYIITRGGDALATDLSHTLLQIGHEKGFINEYKEENAEFLSFDDDSFDYVLIKEAFHHCPRPWIALHEAFRVSKKAVFLIEPNDTYLNFLGKFSNKLKNLLKKILNYKVVFENGYWFEEVGNFGYTVNERELEKFLLGMHYQNIAFCDLNDHYIPGVEFCPAEGGNINNRILQIKIKGYIFFHDLLSKLNLIKPGLLGVILFKETPHKIDLKKLKRTKWRYKNLPKNPYI